MFKDKTLLITGGTGSFGNAVMRILGYTTKGTKNTKIDNGRKEAKKAQEYKRKK